MNSTNPLTHYPLHRFAARTIPPPPLLHAPLKLRFRCAMPRPPNRSRRKPRRLRLNIPSEHSFSSSSSLSTSSDAKLQTVIDLDQLYFSSQSRFQQFLAAGEDAYGDLQTLITFDADRRLVVSCRWSTLRFIGIIVVFGFVVVLGFKVLAGLLRLGSKGGHGSGSYKPVVRRDRSLGGREVVVGTTVERRGGFNARKGFGALSNPLSPAMEEWVSGSKSVSSNWVRGEKKLPKWWPSSVPHSGFPVDLQEYQREANKLIRAIVDNRMGGKDIVQDDIIQLRRICRASGVRASFGTTNTRDSFYRTSVNFVLNVCARSPSDSSSIQIDGEDVRQFIAGLAENIGLENFHAARIVSAAVAASTRSRFLQAWALEMQGKHAEAKEELSKICLVFRIFPPEESAPEIEMVARSLEKHLKVEQREFLLNMLVGICGEDGQRSVAEALGLMQSPTGVLDQQ
ncbi:uncharacterized protein LOC107422081 [Ziziphus jujuba]|uniref:Uncharacterized protein LOC107422081 n=1 Tax=Ziziphus jujuba TaxID=326968 RepID=A0ABM3IRM1_ZIZJJ|nr:uncharacterized protein LOC107422081 [Ziziphus jujuba]